MIALKNPTNRFEVITTIPVQSEQPEQKSAPSPNLKGKEIGRMELNTSHKAILFSVKVYLALMVGLFGYHFCTLIK